MKLCCHVVKFDAGLAPNPFHGYCTTALCTPSHMKAKLEQGDWLVGVSPKADGNRLVYAMRVSERLDMDDYFRDKRFQKKKPNLDGTKIKKCGDNFYYRSGTGWARLPSPFHNNPNDLNKDAGCPVFVAEHFYYFGELRKPIPDKFSKLIHHGRGIRYADQELAFAFVRWMEKHYRLGRLGMPRGMISGECH